MELEPHPRYLDLQNLGTRLAFGQCLEVLGHYDFKTLVKAKDVLREAQEGHHVVYIECRVHLSHGPTTRRIG